MACGPSCPVLSPPSSPSLRSPRRGRSSSITGKLGRGVSVKDMEPRTLPQAPSRDPNAQTAAAAAFASPSTWCLDGTMTLGSGETGTLTVRDAARQKADDDATAEVARNMEKYCGLVRSVSLFSEMGYEEVEAAASALQVKHFKKGEVVFDEVRPVTDVTPATPVPHGAHVTHVAHVTQGRRRLGSGA